MAMLPPGVTTCTITFGKAISYLGTEARIEAVIDADRDIVHAATGWSFTAMPDPVNASAGGELVFQVPHVDQSGFIDGSGAEVKNWYYILSGNKIFPRGTKSFRKVFQVKVGQDNVDLDVVPDGPALPSYTTPLPAVLSVAGETGNISTEHLADALGVSEVIGKRGVPDGIAPLDADANVPDANLPDRLAAEAIDGKLDATAVGVAQGVAPLDVDGKLPEDHVPERLTEAAVAATYAGRKSGPGAESAALGPELIASTGWTLGSGWTGDSATGFTKTAGGTAALSWAPPTPSGTKTFLVEFTVDTPSNANLNSHFAVTLGGSFAMVMYEGEFLTHRYSRGIASVGNGDLVFTPQADFAGTIRDVSIREVVAAAETPFTWEDSTGAAALEMRLGGAALKNMFLGDESGRFNVTGKENAVFGHRSMRSNVSGFWNAGIGHQVLEANVNGSRNCAFGYLALQSNISGHRNIGIGSFALRSNTHGINNIGIGADALWLCTVGSYNIGIGLASLGELVTGESNIGIGIAAGAKLNGITGAVGVGHYANSSLVTSSEPPVAVGYRSLRDATVGGNVAVGHETGRLNTTGTGNSYLGFRAGYANLTGNQQTAMGYEALRFFTGGRNTAFGYGAMKGVDGASTGTRNVVFGDSAGAGITSGSNNVVFGGSCASTLTTGTGNIYVGFNVQPSVPGVNNELNIGNVIYADMSSAKKSVAIGFNGPQARLHLPGGAAGAGLAPLKINSGALLTIPEIGAIEFDGTNLYFTTSAGVRKTLATAA